MRHKKKLDKLSRSNSQRKALVRSLVKNLIIYERIKTTVRRSKVVAAEVEALINRAKKNDLHSRRMAYSFLQNHQLVKKLFEEIAPRFKNINGGFTRRLKLGFRKGDGTEMSLVEFTAFKSEPTKKEGKTKNKITDKNKENVSKESDEKSKESKKGLREGLKGIFKKRKR